MDDSRTWKYHPKYVNNKIDRALYGIKQAKELFAKRQSKNFR